VVVSAPGKRAPEDRKVTDLLIECAEAYAEGGGVTRQAAEALYQVVKRYQDIVQDLGMPKSVSLAVRRDLESRLEAFDAGGLPLGAFVDLMKAAGEDNCARVVAEYFERNGLPAVYVSPKEAGLLLTEEFGNAHVLPQAYANLAAALKDDGQVKVFPGFFGYTRGGRVITFSRGGSDVTGSILAAALGAELYENFTDVSSVFAVDPSVVRQPAPIEALTYREMRELSYSGFTVYHEDALLPVINRAIPIQIKNTNDPLAKGTAIVPSRAIDPARPVVGVSAAAGFMSINISKLLMNDEIGFGRKALQIIEDEGLSFEHMPSGIDNISLILKEAGVTAERERRITDRMILELGVDEVGVRRGLAIVMVVGEGMLHTVGTMARAASALARSGINIEVINQGASEVSVMFGLDAKDATAAVRSLYNEFFGGGGQE